MGVVCMYVRGEEASVEMMDVSVKECGSQGLCVDSGASVKATQCEFSDNGVWGVVVTGGSKGIFTDCTIHHNGGHGVGAYGEGTYSGGTPWRTNGDSPQRKLWPCCILQWHPINIYIPSRSITALVHDHGRDLSTFYGSKIQSQLSSSSLELTIIHGWIEEGADN